MAEGRASGKVILVGEHAVVHGAPALAVAIDHGARAHATRLVRSPSVLRIAAWQVEVTPDDDSPLGRAFRSVLGTRPPTRLELQTDLPPGGGLGCSAALGVAAVRALHPGASLAVVRELAMAWERVFHGNPSGIDAEAAARGGCIWFRRDEGVEAVRVASPLVLCIGKTGVPSSTKVMVERVAALRATEPARVQRAFEQIGRVTGMARHAVEHGEAESLGAAMREAQRILRGLDVSSVELDLVCKIAEGAGALGAKLTGGGGGGCAVALAPSKSVADDIVLAWRRAGFDGFSTVSAEPHPGISQLPKEKAS
jgi:mevalonate kinase